MSDSFASFRPYGLLVSQLTRAQTDKDFLPDPIGGPSGGHEEPVETYMGVPDSVVGFQLAKQLQLDLPPVWQPHVAGIFTMRPMRWTKTYRSDRYIVRFTDVDPHKLIKLLFGEELELLASKIAAQTGGSNLRTDHSGTAKQGWVSGVLALFDLPPGANPGSDSSLLDLFIAQFKTFLGQSDPSFAVAPSRVAELLLTKGLNRGSVLDSACVLRLHRRSDRPAFSLPREVLDWADLSDGTYVIRHLASDLKNAALIDPANYLEPFASADVAKLYDRFLPEWSKSLASHLECRRSRASIDGTLQGRAFLGYAGTGPEFISQMKSRHQLAIRDYKDEETRVVSYREIVSSFLRDASTWQSAQTRNKLAGTQTALASMSNNLAKATGDSVEGLRQASESNLVVAERIADATASTDRLTVRIVWLTWIIVGATFISLLITDKVKEDIVDWVKRLPSHEERIQDKRVPETPKL